MPLHLPEATASGRVETSGLDGRVALRLFVPKPAEWINSNQRLHRMVKTQRVKAWREAAADAVPKGWPVFEQPVRVIAHIWKDRNGRYDPNNLNTTTKACIDGFVDAGLLVDDDWKHVTGPDHRHGGKGEPGIIFLFTHLLVSTVQAE
jgi:crossover junction endodeoxyribonuclease RusA